MRPFLLLAWHALPQYPGGSINTDAVGPHRSVKNAKIAFDAICEDDRYSVATIAVTDSVTCEAVWHWSPADCQPPWRYPLGEGDDLWFTEAERLKHYKAWLGRQNETAH